MFAAYALALLPQKYLHKNLKTFAQNGQINRRRGRVQRRA